jgi:hypothetical protein
MRVRHHLTAFAATLTVLGLPATVHAQATMVKLPSEEQSIGNALGLLFSQAKVPYVIGSGISGRIVFNAGEMPFEKALTLLCQASHPTLTWSKNTDGVYIVRVAEKLPPAPPAPPTPIVNVQNTMPKMPISLMTFTPSSEDPILMSIEMQLLALEVERKSLEVDYSGDYNTNRGKGGLFIPAFERINEQQAVLLRARAEREEVLRHRKSQPPSAKPKAATPSRSAKR